MQAQRVGAVVAVAAVVVLAVLLGVQQRQPRVLSFTMGETSCDYDRATKEAVIGVPLTLTTRGKVVVTVRALLFDRRDPERMAYRSTRRVGFDTDGDPVRKRLTFRISQFAEDWDAGFDRCVVTYDTLGPEDD